MERQHRLGILGGTFNPVHNGHLKIAQMAKDQWDLDEVWFLPAGDPPHKEGLVRKDQRLDMVRLAVNGIPDFSVSTLEIERQGITYTVDTMRHLTQTHPDWKIYYIVGADTLLYLETWKEVEQVLRMCEILVALRPGTSRSDMQRKATQIQQDMQAKVHLLKGEGPEFSSTSVREIVADIEVLKSMVPVAVAEYIIQNHLYGGEAP